MTDIRALVALTPSSGANKSYMPVDIFPDGSLSKGEQWQRYINAGRGFSITVGSFDTPIVGGGNGTVLDQDQPELVISIPSGVYVVLLSARIQCELPANTDADVYQILLAADVLTNSNASSSTGTVETPINMLGGSARTSSCTIVSANTSNITNPTLGLEIARKQMTADVVTSGITQGVLDLVYEPKFYRIFKGPQAIYAYWGGTAAVSGFAQVDYVELDASDYGNLFVA